MKKILFFFFCCVYSQFCSAGFSPAIVQQLDAAVQQAFDDLELVGITAGVWVPSQGTWVRTKGTGNVAAKRPILYGDVIRIGSITKSFVTTVILQLVDEGLISLDQTIESFNTGIPNADQITIRQLCNHTSGLFNYTKDPRIAERFFDDPLGFISPQQLIQIAIDHGPVFPPGTQVQYSNTGFIVQGVIIEQVTGHSLEREIEARILTPLRFLSTSLPTSSLLQGEFSHGYFVLPDKLQDFTFFNPSYSWASGGMISKLTELKTWAKVLATGIPLLTPATQQQRLTFVSPPPTPDPFDGPFLKYGLGIEALGPLLGHEGNVISYDATVNYLPSQDATFVVLLNRNPTSSFPSDEATLIVKALSKILFPSEVPW